MVLTQGALPEALRSLSSLSSPVPTAFSRASSALPPAWGGVQQQEPVIHHFPTWPRKDLIANSNRKAASPARLHTLQGMAESSGRHSYTCLQRPQPRLTWKGWLARSGQPTSPTRGPQLQKNGPCCARQVQGTGEGPEGQDGHGAGALACFLIIYLTHKWEVISKRLSPNERNPGVREKRAGTWPQCLGAAEVSGRLGGRRVHSEAQGH